MNFSEEWDKLKNLKVGQIITTFRWNDYPVVVGQNIQIKLKGKVIAYAYVDSIDEIIMKQIPLNVIQKDTKSSMTYEEFYSMMSYWYQSKPNYAGLNSILKLYFLKIRSVM